MNALAGRDAGLGRGNKWVLEKSKEEDEEEGKDFCHGIVFFFPVYKNPAFCTPEESSPCYSDLS